MSEGPQKVRTHTRRCVPIIRRMYLLAKKRSGWRWPALFHVIGYSRHRGNDRRYVQMAHAGEFPQFEYYMKLAEIAGIPKPIAVTIYAMSCVPKEYQKYIGCTVAPGRRKSSWKMSKEDFRTESEAIIAEVTRGQHVNQGIVFRTPHI